MTGQEAVKPLILRVGFRVRIPVASLLPSGRSPSRHLVVFDLAPAVRAVGQLLVDLLKRVRISALKMKPYLRFNNQLPGKV